MRQLLTPNLRVTPNLRAVETARKVSPSVLEEHRARYVLQEGDFIFGKIGTIGRPARLLPPFDYTLSANVVLIQPNSNHVNPEYLFAYMCSPRVASLVQKEEKATTQAAFGIKRIRELLLSLPPLDEQRRIVTEVDRRPSLVRETEAQIDANLQRAERLRRSFLAAAFGGRACMRDVAAEQSSAVKQLSACSIGSGRDQ